MKIFKPILAVDIETTGLDPDKCSIIEIAMIFDDLGTYGGIRKEFNIHIDPENGKWEEAAVEFHAQFSPRNNSNEIIYSQAKAQEMVLGFLKDCYDICGHSLSMVGKRATDLVYPFLKKHDYINDQYIHHQHIDISSLYYIEQRGLMPLYKLAKYYKIEHDGSAMSDARLSMQLFLNKIEKELF